MCQRMSANNRQFDRLLSRFPRVRRSGAGWVAQCPAHDDRMPSLSISLGSEGRLLLYCHAGCRFNDILRASGLSRDELFINGAMRPWDTREARIAAARLLWDRTKCALGTLVEVYFRSRGITIPPPPPIRFTPLLKNSQFGWPFPAMLAGIQYAGGEFAAVQVTWLAADGSDKAPVEVARKTFGPARGGAVRLAQAGELLAIAEGIETALSVQQATGIPTWAVLGTSNLSHVELPDAVREVIICADNDPNGAGERAAIKAARRFQREGRRTRLVTAEAGDFNDMVTVR